MPTYVCNISTMAHLYSKYKEVELLLQQRITPLGYTATVEPITGADLYYSDGSAAQSYGKVVFTSQTSEFVVFFPDMYCYYAVPTPIKEALEAWLKEVA
jgi:hypothetical protein